MELEEWNRKNGRGEEMRPTPRTLVPPLRATQVIFLRSMRVSDLALFNLLPEHIRDRDHFLLPIVKEQHACLAPNHLLTGSRVRYTEDYVTSFSTEFSNGDINL